MVSITQPLNTFRFRVNFEDAYLTIDQLAELSKCVITVDLDLVNKNGQIILRQTVLPECLHHIIRLITGKMGFSIDCLTVDSEVINSLVFYRVKILWHQQQFNYAEAKVVEHQVKFKFKSYYVY